MKDCQQCRLEFDPSRSFQKFCCAKCRIIWYRENYYASYDRKRIDKEIRRKEYYKKKRLDIIDCVKKYYKVNREQILAQKVIYGKEHRIDRNHSARMRYTDPKNKLNQSMAVLIRRSIGTRKGRRRWESLVNYTLTDLRNHLEKYFKSGMTWDNYGNAWHIDHKVPRSVFNFDKPEDIDFSKCWCLSNLQPMWAKENIRKRDKLSAPFQPSLAMG